MKKQTQKKIYKKNSKKKKIFTFASLAATATFLALVVATSAICKPK